MLLSLLVILLGHILLSMLLFSGWLVRDCFLGFLLCCCWRLGDGSRLRLLLFLGLDQVDVDVGDDFLFVGLLGLLGLLVLCILLLFLMVAAVLAVLVVLAARMAVAVALIMAVTVSVPVLVAMARECVSVVMLLFMFLFMLSFFLAFTLME